MRAAIVAMLILLLPAALFAFPTMGIFFCPTLAQMTYYPEMTQTFTGYVFGVSMDCWVSAVEFGVELPPNLYITAVTIPEEAIQEGALPAGLAIAYYPPQDGWSPGYNLLCTLTLLSASSCYSNGGTFQDSPLRIIPHAASGHIYGACYPSGTLFDITGMTSLICPDQIAVQDKSWGAIKSLF